MAILNHCHSHLSKWLLTDAVQHGTAAVKKAQGVRPKISTRYGWDIKSEADHKQNFQ